MSMTPQGPDIRTDDRAASGSTDLRIEDGAATQTDVGLLTRQQRDEFEARWRDVQTAFVDEPQGAVDRADTLVGEVVDAVTAGFAARRSQLEQRWAAEGEEAATENLRQSLRAYREFFDRLLKI